MRSDNEQLKVILERAKRAKAAENRRRVYLYSALMCVLCVIVAVAVAVVLSSPIDKPIPDDDAVLNGGNLDISSESAESGNDTAESDEKTSSESDVSMENYGEKYITLMLSEYSSAGIKPDGEHLSEEDDTLAGEDAPASPNWSEYPDEEGSDEVLLSGTSSTVAGDEIYSTLYYRFDMAETYEDLDRLWVEDGNSPPSYVSNLGNAMKWMLYYGDASWYHTVLYLEGAENANQYLDILRESGANCGSSNYRITQCKSFVQDGKYMLYCVLSAEAVRIFAENGVRCSYVGDEDGFVNFEILESADDIKSFCQIYGDGYTVHEP